MTTLGTDCSVNLDYSANPVTFVAEDPSYGFTSTATGNYAFNINSGAQLNIQSGTYEFNTVNIAGTVVMNGGEIKGKSNVNVGNSGTGTVTINNGGKVSGATVNIGAGGTGDVTVNNGGTLSAKNYILVGNGGAGSLVIENGGLVNHTQDKYLSIGYSGGNGIVTIKTGGTYENIDGLGNATMAHASGLTGTLNIEGGTFKAKGILYLNYNAGAKKSSVSVTDGGVLWVDQIKLENAGTEGGTVTIDNGTLKYYGNAASFIPAYDSLHVYVGAGGVTIDTNAKTANIGEPLQAVENTAGGLSVVGGGTAVFSASGNLAGAFTIGENTALRYFDKDGVVSNYTVAGLSIAPGATLYLNADATGCDTFSAATTNITATTENPAKIKLLLAPTSIPASTETFALFEVDDADKIVVEAETTTGVALEVAKTYENGVVRYAILARDYIWNDGANGGGWTDGVKWNVDGNAAAWADNNNAVFANAGDVATLDADVTMFALDFRANATIDTNTTASISTPKVIVDSGVSATVNAPISTEFTKEGAGTLLLGVSRGEVKTTLSEGTLAMAPGATITPVNNSGRLQIGTSATPVVFDYGGQTLSWHPGYYFGGVGANVSYVTLTNGVFQYAGGATLAHGNSPKSLTIAKDATFANTGNYIWYVGGNRDATVRIVGGKISTEGTLYMMNTGDGTMNVEVSDGGILESQNTGEFLCCTTEGLNAPKLKMKFTNGSVFRTKNTNLYFGYSTSNKNPTAPEFVLAMTNSFIDVGTAGVILGYNTVGSNTAGGYTADFESCVITAAAFKVYCDRPANAARFNNSTIVFTADNNWSLEAQADNVADLGEAWVGTTPISVGPLGLTLDTQTYTSHLKCNPQGDGAITKKGAGKLIIPYAQTASAAFVCEAGEMFLNDGLVVSRPVTVKNGAKFTVKAATQSTVAGLTLEAGSTLNFDTYTAGVVPLSVTTFALPESGTATLTLNGGVFTTGTYPILEKSGITVEDVSGKLVPSVGEGSYSYSVSGNALVLTVGTPVHGRLSAFAISGAKMSVAGNWEDGVVPEAGEDLDFSGVSSSKTIEADIDAKFGAVTMGSGVITFTGANMCATSFSDTSKIAVGANAIVTLDGDLTATGFIVNKTDGDFVVTGKITQGTGQLYPAKEVGSGRIVAGGLVKNNEEWNFRPSLSGKAAKWVIGSQGIVGDKIYYQYDAVGSSASFQAYDSDFVIGDWLAINQEAEFDTTGYKDGQPHVITAGNGTRGGIYRHGAVTIKGTGTFVCNYDAHGSTQSGSALNNSDKYGTGDDVSFTVTDTATLAIMSGKNLGTGALTINSGATLKVAESGTVTLGGNLDLADGATLAFNFTDREDEPTLAIPPSTTVTANGRVNVNVSLANGVARLKAGEYNLTTGCNFANDTDLTVTYPQNGQSGMHVVVKDGNLVLKVVSGVMILLK